MRKNILLAKHLTISLVVLSIMIGVIFLAFSLISSILSDPHKYFNTGLSGEELQLVIIRLLLIVTSVLVSYVTYLLLSSHTRSELIVFNATKSLNASLEQFARLYEEAPVPYIILNEAGKIHKPNKAALRFFGVVSEEIEGKNLFQYQPEEDKDKIEKLTRYYKASIPINREETRMVTKSGAIRWALLSVFEIRNRKDSAHTGLATIFDITDQKKLDQAKTEFVSLASHQLRTPVAAIKWFMEMLLSGNMGELSPKQKDYIDRMQKINKEMVDLVDTLLNVSRIEIGTIKVEFKPTSVIDLTESILVELSSQIQEKRDA